MIDQVILHAVSITRAAYFEGLVASDFFFPSDESESIASGAPHRTFFHPDTMILGAMGCFFFSLSVSTTIVSVV